jgi:hypothetical protein
MILVQTVPFDLYHLSSFAIKFVVLVDLMVKRIRENCMLNAGLDISSGEVKHATARAQVKFYVLVAYILHLTDSCPFS